MTNKDLENIHNILNMLKNKVLQNETDLINSIDKTMQIKKSSENIVDFSMKIKLQLATKNESNYSAITNRTIDKGIKLQIGNSECEIFKKRAKDLQEENNKLLAEIKSLHIKILSNSKTRKSNSPEISQKESFRQTSPQSLENRERVIIGEKFNRNKRSGSSQIDTKNTSSLKSKIFFKDSSSEKKQKDNSQLLSSRILENPLNSNNLSINTIDIHKNLKLLIKKLIGNYCTTLEQLFDQIQNIKNDLKENCKGSIDYLNSLIEESKLQLNTFSKKFYRLCRIEERQLTVKAQIDKEKTQVINNDCTDTNKEVIKENPMTSCMIHEITRNKSHKVNKLEHVTEEKIEKEIPFLKKYSVPVSNQKQINEYSKGKLSNTILNSFRENNVLITEPKLPLHVSGSCKLSEKANIDKPISINEKIKTNDTQISKVHISELKNNVSKLTILINQRESEIEKLQKRNFDLFSKLQQNEKLKVEIFQKYDDLKNLIYNNFQSYDTMIKIREEKIVGLYSMMNKYRLNFENWKLKPGRSTSQEPIKNLKKITNIQSEKNLMLIQINSLKNKIKSLECGKDGLVSRLPIRKIEELNTITISRINQNREIIKSNSNDSKLIMISNSQINKTNPKINKLVNQNTKLKNIYNEMNKKLNDKEELIQRLILKINENEKSEKSSLQKCNLLESKLKEFEKGSVFKNLNTIQKSHRSAQSLNIENMRLERNVLASQLSIENCFDLYILLEKADLNNLNKELYISKNSLSEIKIPFLNLKQKNLNTISGVIRIDLKPMQTLKEIEEKLKISENQNSEKSNEIFELQNKIKILVEESLKYTGYYENLSKTYNENLEQKENRIKNIEIQISQLESHNEKLKIETRILNGENQKIKVNIGELNQYIERFEIFLKENNKNINELFTVVELGETSFENSKSLEFLPIEYFFPNNAINISNEKSIQILRMLHENKQKELILILGFIEYFYKFRVQLLKPLALEIFYQELNSSSI